MNKQMPIVSLALPAVVLYLAAAGFARSAEPTYQGKPLSEWLLALQRNAPTEEVSEEMQKQDQSDPDALEKARERLRKRNEDALRQMGKNALPTLLEMLGATSDNFTNVVGKLQAREFRQGWWSDDSHVDDLRSLAIEGFEVLGTNAESAVPQLTKLFHNAETSFEAARALTRVGPKGLSVLTNALNNPKDPSRGAAIWWLREASVDATTRDSLLIPRLGDKDDVNRHNAAIFLAGKDPAAIPALIKMLDEDTNYLAVSGAAEALAKFGAAAKDAVPRLFSSYTNHVVARDRHEAQAWASSLMQALQAIDTNAAAKAEAFLVASGPLNYARNGYTITLLTNGQELIAGGYIHTEVLAASNRFLANAQLNDPVTGRWTETGEMKTARNSHTATLLRDGRVLVAAGTDSKGHALASAELYDPATGKWTETRPLNIARFYHTAALQSDGRVMVAGGHTGYERIYDTEFYDPANGTWTAGPAITNLLPAARQDHSATVLADGKVLVAGGSGTASRRCLSTAELYDPASDTWTNTGSLNIARMAHQATLLPNGKVLVTGGSTSDASDAKPELYDPATGKWTIVGSTGPNRSVHTTTLLRNGKVLVTGVEAVWNRRSFAEQYDPASGKWAATSALSDVRQGCTATLLSNGKVLVAGGRWGTGGTWTVIADSRLYDPATEKWSTTGAMKVERWRHTATLLPDGKVLVAGGSGSWLEPLSSAELYNPETGKWTSTGTMHQERYDHTATILANGEVLVAGSYENAGDALSSAEVYSPTTGKWTALHRFRAEHAGHTATLLPDGRVLIVGGDAVGRIEFCDPRANR
jgi:N-acetylneuraminic acid mutarotase/HEAT repeat protein